MHPPLLYRYSLTFPCPPSFSHVAVIGPFEAKYEECQKEVVAMAMYGREVYQKSYQKLIDEFGYQ